MSRIYLGDYAPASTVRVFFNSVDATGAPVTLAGSPAASVYKDGGTTESTSGVGAVTVDFDARTGLHVVTVDTSADGTFYSAGSDFRVVLTAGTVGSISVVGRVVGTFSLNNRTALRPTTAGRTLDVSAGGEAGIDWSNVGSPTTSVDLSGTTIAVTQRVDLNTIKTQAVTCSAGVTVPSLLASTTNITAGTITTVTTVTNQLTAAQIATGVWQDATAGDFTTASSIGKCLYIANVAPGAAGGHFIAGTNAATTITTGLTTTFTGNLTGSVGSVTGAVGSVTGAVGSVTAAVTLSQSAVLASPRALDAVADGSLTISDALHCAIAAAAGKESVVSTTYTVKTPSTGTTLRTFTLDSATTPTSRT